MKNAQSYLIDPSFNSLRQSTEAVRFLKTLDGAERRAIRSAAQVSRHALAELLAVPESRIQAYETGTTPNGVDAVNYAGALKAMSPPPDARLSMEERARVLEYFDQERQCTHCQGVHARACPRVRSASYHENGQLHAAEYWPDGEWPQDGVIFRDSPEMQE